MDDGTIARMDQVGNEFGFVRVEELGEHAYGIWRNGLSGWLIWLHYESSIGSHGSSRRFRFHIPPFHINVPVQNRKPGPKAILLLEGSLGRPGAHDGRQMKNMWPYQIS